jgi:homoserine O-acetyltransferase
MKIPSLILIGLFFSVFTKAQQSFPSPLEGDFSTSNFEFESGEKLDHLNLHYATLGKPVIGKNGLVKNAILVMHGTTGSSKDLLTERFSGHLFGPGQILDASRYYIVFTDAIGHGKSSRPSDGLHMKFPKYTYKDMVKAQYILLTEGLKVNHLRLAIGTSMGAMHTWVWGYTYPDFMDALMPLASLPVEIAGRNRMMRKMAINLIEMDPEWKGGEYTQEPKLGLSGAISSLIFMSSSPLQMQKTAPTRVQAEELLDKTETRYLSILDANNVIYAFDASRNYNPDPYLDKIKAPLLAINSADDEVNPPELGIMEKEIVKVAKGKYILLPISDQTSGHGTHSNPVVWGQYLKQFMADTEKPEKL